jgi:glyoxylase-like metal-dependent hydrolase (beta-lactamase superfamily II)
MPPDAWKERPVNNGIRVGNISIHQVIEQEAPFFDFRDFFPTLSDEIFDENRSWLEPHFLDPATGKIVLRIQSYILQTLHHNILIDPCIGNHKPRPARPFWNMLNSDRYERNLAATGLTVKDIDYVMCTHLHPDHVGWNTRLQNGRWVPTFPKAKHIMADRELAHWSARHKENPDACPWITDSVLPVVEAGKVEVVKSEHTLNDLVHLIPTPGHTIDHFSVEVGRTDEKAIITGDMIHSPLQAYYPDIGMFSDYDSKQAGNTRRELLGRYCDSPTLFCTAHFPLSSIGRICRCGDAFKFVPIQDK